MSQAPLTTYKIPFMSRGGVTFPTPARYMFKWAQQFQLVSTASSSTGASIRANSLFDPMFRTNLGDNQPLWFSQVCNSSGPYLYYCVYFAKFWVNITNLSSNGDSTALGMMMMRSLNASAPDTYDEILLAPYAVRKTIMPLGQGQSSVWLKFNVDMAKFLGVADVLDDQGSVARFNANPSSPLYLDVIVAPQIPTSANYTYNVRIQGRFYAVLIGDQEPHITQNPDGATGGNIGSGGGVTGGLTGAGLNGEWIAPGDTGGFDPQFAESMDKELKWEELEDDEKDITGHVSSEMEVPKIPINARVRTQQEIDYDDKKSLYKRGYRPVYRPRWDRWYQTHRRHWDGC